MEILRIDSEFSHHLNTGVVSYWKDFRKVVIPELHKHFNVTWEDVPADKIISFHKRIDPEHKFGNPDAQVVRILHTPDIEKFVTLQHPIGDVINITHYRHLTERRGKYSYPNAITKYIPMSLNTADIPRPAKKNGKVIYFGNLEGKLGTWLKLGKTGVEFDTMSMNKLNTTTLMRDKKDVWDCVSQYEIVIAVGRAALEALAMGCKVIIAGRNYSGAIPNKLVLYNQRLTNINSDKFQIDPIENFAKDIQVLRDSNFLVEKDEIDMRHQAEKYIDYLWDFSWQFKN